ncbi:MAG TPA: hypothetical protein VJO99_20065, partial [Burkholderiaceae bacterium]|nr:hypothetical protein [Burkholderiaceae bacterium]
MRKNAASLAVSGSSEAFCRISLHFARTASVFVGGALRCGAGRGAGLVIDGTGVGAAGGGATVAAGGAAAEGSSPAGCDAASALADGAGGGVTGSAPTCAGGGFAISVAGADAGVAVVVVVVDAGAATVGVGVTTAAGRVQYHAAATNAITPPSTATAASAVLRAGVFGASWPVTAFAVAVVATSGTAIGGCVGRSGSGAVRSSCGGGSGCVGGCVVSMRGSSSELPKL